MDITLFSIWNYMHQWWLSASFLQWTLCHFGRRIATTWLTRLLAWRYECPTVSQLKNLGKTCLTPKRMQQKKTLGSFRIYSHTRIDHHQTSFDNPARRCFASELRRLTWRQPRSSEHGLSSNLALLVARISPSTNAKRPNFHISTKRKEPTPTAECQ